MGDPFRHHQLKQRYPGIGTGLLCPSAQPGRFLELRLSDSSSSSEQASFRLLEVALASLSFSYISREIPPVADLQPVSYIFQTSFVPWK